MRKTRCSRCFTPTTSHQSLLSPRRFPLPISLRKGSVLLKTNAEGLQTASCAPLTSQSHNREAVSQKPQGISSDFPPGSLLGNTSLGWEIADPSMCPLQMSDRRSIFETSPWLASRILASCNCVIRLGFTQLIERHRPQTLLEPPLDSPLPLSRHCFQQFTKFRVGVMWFPPSRCQANASMQNGSFELSPDPYAAGRGW